MSTHTRHFDPAPRLKRIGAFLIDLALIYVYIIVLFMASIALNAAWPFHQALGESYILRHLVAFLTLSLPVFLYFTLMESGGREGTFGKRWMGLRVVAWDDSHAGFRQVALRNALKFLPWEMAHTHIHLNPEFATAGTTSTTGWILGVALPIGLMLVWGWMALFSRSGVAPYERLSDTHVVRATSTAGKSSAGVLRTTP